MAKIKNLKTSLLKYLVPCFGICAAGILIIKLILSYFMNWYNYKISTQIYFPVRSEYNDTLLLYILNYGEYLIVPLWSVLCLYIAVKIYYKHEIENPINILTKASEKILNDDLDFKIDFSSSNELGALCVSFEEMRKSLYDSNYQLWKSLEERKRLNSSFSHDLRTPITVLKGYSNLINQYNGSLSTEKQTEILSKMSGQIDRLERYTEKMSSLHKMEDLIPEINIISYSKLCSQLKENGSILCKDKEFEFSSEEFKDDTLYSDEEIIIEVMMNLITNACRYAANKIVCSSEVKDDMLTISVSDDGCGFSEESLRKAWQPFYREGDANDKEHFGLGLYICRLLCKKAGGDIRLENNEYGGGKVTALFFIKNLKNQIKS